MENYIVNVVSYKRSNNTTCNRLKNTQLNWRVFVYHFDPFLQEYLKNYNSHVFIINSMDFANLSIKRQLVLDESIKDGYKYCYMLDDDIENIYLVRDGRLQYEISLSSALDKLYVALKNNQYLVALSASYNKADTFKEIEKYKSICNNIIFNLNEYKKYNVKYNKDSKCEDAEFTIDLILEGAIPGRLNSIVMKNTLQGGTTHDGLSYRFEKTNRFLEEGSYLANKYSKYKNAFEFDENHFKIKTSLLLSMIQEK